MRWCIVQNNVLHQRFSNYGSHWEGVKFDIVHMRDQVFSKQSLNKVGSLHTKTTPKQVLANENLTPKQVLF